MNVTFDLCFKIKVVAQYFVNSSLKVSREGYDADKMVVSDRYRAHELLRIKINHVEIRYMFFSNSHICTVYY